MKDIAFPILTMSSREIATLLEKQHSNIKISAERLAASGVIGTLAVQGFTHNGNSYTEYLLSKRDSLILVAQNCPEFTARIVDRWQELEAQVAKPAAAAPVFTKAHMVQAMEFAEATARMLNLEGSARLGMARKVTSIVVPHLLPALPVYAIDAPAGSAAGSSEPTASLTTLLKQKNLKVSAAKANKVLQDLDILEQLFRPSSSGTDRTFWAITGAGKKYGKNVTHPNNQRETQPHWFVEQADALVHLIATHIQ